MNNRTALLAQAIRGPILMITVGALFALHQANILPFSSTWPLVIIVVGVVKLVEKMNVPTQSAPLGGRRP